MYKINVNPRHSEFKPLASVFDELLNGGLSTILGTDLVQSSPQVNILEEDHVYILEIAAPGLNKEDFKLNLENDTLTVSLEAVDRENLEDKNFIRREYRMNAFKKSFQLPETVNRADINAAYENGVLRITLPKMVKDESEWKRTIEIL